MPLVELLSDSRLSKLMKNAKQEGQIPSYLIVQVIEKALGARRAAIHGWSVFNFPPEYGEALVTEFARGQFTPNRVVLFDQRKHISGFRGLFFMVQIWRQRKRGFVTG